MTSKRLIEIYSAECPICKGTIDKIIEAMCPSCDVTVLDMHDDKVAAKAKSLGIRSVPAVVIDGKLAGGSGAGIDMDALKEAVPGKPSS
jgi:glutaredoxin 3